MKIRSGFVSNSSSSRFIIRKKDLTILQLELIHNHDKDLPDFDPTKSWACDKTDAWEIMDCGDHIQLSTHMDNFDMYSYLQEIGVDMDKIEYEDY